MYLSDTLQGRIDNSAIYALKNWLFTKSRGDVKLSIKSFGVNCNVDRKLHVQ